MALRFFLKILSQLVITRPGKTSFELSSADPAVKDVLRANPKGFGGKDFFGMVNQAKDKVVFPRVRRTGYKICSDDDIRCVFDIQIAYLVFKGDDVSSLFIHIEGLIKQGKKLAVNDGGIMVEPISLLIYIHHTWGYLIVPLAPVFSGRHLPSLAFEDERDRSIIHQRHGHLRLKLTSGHRNPF